MDFTFQNGRVIVRLTEAQEWSLLESTIQAYAKAKAEQEALSTVYTMEELPRRLKCSKRKLYDLVQAGVIRRQKVGNKYIISEQAVREWLGDL